MNLAFIMNLNTLKQEIFQIKDEQDFNELSLRIFHYQFQNCKIYREYVQLLYSSVSEICHYTEIPFLPIEFFKSHKVICEGFNQEDFIFHSSGTTGSNTSKHFLADSEIYNLSFIKCFELYYGKPEQYEPI